MSNISITESEVVPFYEANWVTVMQMKHYEISVTVNQEGWETIEQIRKQLDDIIEERRQHLATKIPFQQTQQRWLVALKKKLEERTSPTEFMEIITEIKSIT